MNTQTTRVLSLTLLVVMLGGWWWSSRRAPTSTATPADAPPAKILRVGIESNYPPYEFIQDGQLAGFEVELVRELAQRLHKDISFADMAFDNLLLALKGGKVDLVAAALTPTPERAQQVAFTRPFLQDSPLVIVSLASKPVRSESELAGKQVIVNDGYSFTAYVSNLPQVTVKSLPTPQDALLELKSARSDAYVVAANTAKSYVAHDNPELFVITPLPYQETTAFAVSKEHSELLAACNSALAAMEQDGFLRTLKQKWHMNEP